MATRWRRVDVYFRQCSVAVTARDLALMAATLANGGVQPAHRDGLLAPRAVLQRVLSVMATLRHVRRRRATG